jgi:hypothetical protein
MKHKVYGLMAEFENPDELLEAARKAHDAGYRRMDGYSPFPIEGLAETIGFHRTWLPLIVLLGGIAGGITGFGMQYYLSAIDYPLNIGGRPLNSWPAFIPITFELTILFAAISAVLGIVLLNGFPRPYHPVFNVHDFAMASRNRFFLCIESSDPKFDREQTRNFLQNLKPHAVSEVMP